MHITHDSGATLLGTYPPNFCESGHMARVSGSCVYVVRALRVVRLLISWAEGNDLCTQLMETYFGSGAAQYSAKFVDVT